MRTDVPSRQPVLTLAHKSWGSVCVPDRHLEPCSRLVCLKSALDLGRRSEETRGRAAFLSRAAMGAVLGAFSFASWVSPHANCPPDNSRVLGGREIEKIVHSERFRLSTWTVLFPRHLQLSKELIVIQLVICLHMIKWINSGLFPCFATTTILQNTVRTSVHKMII